MDKEKCIFNKNGSCNIYAWSCDYADSCKGNPDCIIKRLQAENEELKEQLDNNFKLCSDCSTTHSFNLQVSENKKLQAENERLKKSIEYDSRYNDMQAELDCGDKLITELTKENERLKEECTLYDCGNKEWAIEYKKLEDDYTELIDRLDDISYDKSNYYQALQEIRDIVETCLKYYKCEKCKFYKECQCDLEEYIITKINEVIGTGE